MEAVPLFKLVSINKPRLWLQMLTLPFIFKWLFPTIRLYWSTRHISESIYYSSHFRSWIVIFSVHLMWHSNENKLYISYHLAITINAVLLDYVQGKIFPALHATFCTLTKCLLNCTRTKVDLKSHWSMKSIVVINRSHCTSDASVAIFPLFKGFPYKPYRCEWRSGKTQDLCHILITSLG